MKNDTCNVLVNVTKLAVGKCYPCLVELDDINK